ncbi:MAG: [acyl-carrier-protein] S-malonyltransferase [Nitrospirae bacterium GWC2_57_13]|jgi:[acyl-carrier-protein] S-malonyltransferase|nr:MAG: [acyl-carrier-protein] S-malonyltransferase [Nitrospirae bacterium GWC1_57_7]OGW28410.1 MAG: [acyl-carrier-protein] S-malonyltransferase [Nitrospirae bacterium GWC2_57_13]OGW46601.1 MAG: [acyl-carrier-protein] S-malonyltransferase [Nitrospirae bacterium GWD2_57_8]HAR45896.1 [acyl-carrier-protein] S-malonyltransferase [Nitrospiraceae bacterium]HAS53204.1 [acyl-carrier-protein] S-malonyltransferase [Nitrospiraceae bacterium]
MKTAYLFPGQGSQYVGMAKEFIEQFEESKQVFETASSVLGYDLTRLCLHGPAEQLNLTENTQPAILAASIAILLPFERRGLKAEAVAGHSLGEYTAITAADGITLQDAIALVRKRGRYMQEAVPEGAGLMAAVLGMSRGDVEKTCLEASKNGIVAPANYNSPGQIVIAGEKKAVEHAMELARAAGAKKVVPLAVSVPSHCVMMKPAGDRLAKELDAVVISDLRIPVVNNADAKMLRTAAELRPSLIRQISSPLYWEDSITALTGQGFDTFIEIGPGKVLSGLVKRIAKDAKILNVEDLKSMDETLKAVGAA